jgi:hypothetical protein
MILDGAPVVIATVAGFLAIYVIAHVLAGRSPDQASKDLAGSIVLRISGLHGLVLGLVFAQLAGEMRQLQSALVDDAAYVTQIHRNAGLHGGPGSLEIRDAMLA